MGVVTKKERPGVPKRKPASKLKSLLGGTVNKAESSMTAPEKMDLAVKGITKEQLEKLKQLTEMDYDQLAWIFSVARATLINKVSGEKFNLTLSEKILGVADIYSFGYRVFQDEKKFNDWMFINNRALGGRQPFEFLNNQFGREAVRDLIGRIEFGVYS